jgi:Arc/MetJ-type ribon-helix-helix transcriptional regulator
MGYQFPPELAEKVRRHMETGRFQSEEELLDDALEALDLVHPVDDEELRAELEERWAESEADEGEPLDVDAAIARLESRMNSINGG